MSHPAPAAPAAAALGSSTAQSLITGLAHVNLTVPAGTLDAVRAFYGDTLGLAERTVPAAQAHELVWFDVDVARTQQVHVAVSRGPDDANAAGARRHPCFRLADAAALAALHRRVADHRARGGPAAPLAVDPEDPPAAESTGAYPARFFARDFAGNRLEFSL